MGLFGIGGQKNEAAPNRPGIESVHKSFSPIDENHLANNLFLAEHPERSEGDALKPWFIFHFEDPSVLDVFDEKEHPVKIEKTTDGYTGTVWCTDDKVDFATTEEMILKGGGIIVKEDPRKIKPIDPPIEEIDHSQAA